MGNSYYKIPSPVGPLYAGIENNKLVYLTFLERKDLRTDEPELILELKKQLNAYFNGDLKEFNLPYKLNKKGFSERVLKELSKVPYGTTISYSGLAKKAGNSKAARAVGSCCHNNPICLIIPCHRVILNDGRIGEFAGGSEIKKNLLELEGIKIKNGKRRT